MSIFSLFERRVVNVATPKNFEHSGPPAGLFAFYWHFVRQTKGLYLAMLVTGLGVALIDMLVPIFIGRMVGLMSTPSVQLQHETHFLIAIAFLILVGRPLVMFIDSAFRNLAVLPGVTTLIRWQSHWHVVRQSLPFFQNDFAGRIANRVMNTANSLRESVVSSIRAIWYIAVYGTTSVVLLLSFDWRLAVPAILWIIAYIFFLRFWVPKMRDLSKASSEARSAVMGRVVDSYSNIMTVKLFARAKDEDAWVRESLDDHREKIAAHMRMITSFMTLLTILNACLVVSTALLGLWLWSKGQISPVVVATALPLAWQISNQAGWVSWEVAGIFENIGVVQEGMESIAVPHSLLDDEKAKTLEAKRGEIRFEKVRFTYGQAAADALKGVVSDKPPVLNDLDLLIRPGERVGLVGRSGAGKSTLVNLLQRFNDVEGGRILIDGQDVREVTQESLRAAIGMVTQDTSLLHRSIAANIRYGRPEASDEEVRRAAEQAHAEVFIEALEDWKGRKGYAAHVGERGVKLSGGQRQRIALARVLLKNAPILILDEATSALDSEVEAAIQEQLGHLMQGKTVIAIAHRLSTIARMDRLIIMDQGVIIEQGNHQELLALDGHYAKLWHRQSGGFLPEA